MTQLTQTVSRVSGILQTLRTAAVRLKEIVQPYVPFIILVMIFCMFPLGYFESLRWPIHPPKATHGFLKGMFMLLAGLCFIYRKEYPSRLKRSEGLAVLFFVMSFVVSALFSMVPDTSLLFLWYPLTAGTMVYALSVIRLSKTQILLVLSLSMILISVTFGFAFFSLMFRYDVTNLYYFLFLDARANFLLDELRTSGKYVSLGPYIMLMPLSLIFLIERKSSFARKGLAGLMYGISVLTAVISNNRIDVLVMAIQTLVILWIIPRRLAIIMLLLVIPITALGLSTSQRYFGYNLEERILRPHNTRDIETIEVRFVYWQNALRNFRLHPLFGTGPNTYNDVTDFPLRRYFDQGAKEYTVRKDYGIGIHNVFLERLADTGLFGLFTFIVMLYIFAKADLLEILKRKGERRARYILFSLSSWTWIMYSITDNGYGAQGFVTFFFIRGLLHHI